MPLLPLLQWIISPIGRLIAIGALIMAISVGAYVKIRSDAVRQHEAKQAQRDLWKLKNAIDARDNVYRSGSDGLLEDDGYRRK
jgi:hypothetical protein